MSYFQYNCDFPAGILRIYNFPLGGNLEVTYDGGYPVDGLPPDLERAMWGAFMELWRNTDQDTGGPPPTGGGEVITGSGDVKSVTVFDAFKLDYDVGTTTTGGETAAATAQDLWGWLAPWQSTLSLYRAGSTGVGLGVV